MWMFRPFLVLKLVSQWSHLNSKWSTILLQMQCWSTILLAGQSVKRGKDKGPPFVDRASNYSQPGGLLNCTVHIVQWWLSIADTDRLWSRSSVIKSGRCPYFDIIKNVSCFQTDEYSSLTWAFSPRKQVDKNLMHLRDFDGNLLGWPTLSLPCQCQVFKSNDRASHWCNLIVQNFLTIFHWVHIVLDQYFFPLWDSDGQFDN